MVIMILHISHLCKKRKIPVNIVQLEQKT